MPVGPVLTFTYDFAPSFAGRGQDHFPVSPASSRQAAVHSSNPRRGTACPDRVRCRLCASLQMSMNKEQQIHTYANDLMVGRSSLAKSLGQLNRWCLTGRWAPDVQAQQIQAVQTIFQNRDVGHLLMAAHGKTRWPAFFGQSPYGEVFALLNLAMAGLSYRREHNQIERTLHEAMFAHVAPAAALARAALNDKGRANRYPRLLDGMREVAILSHTEADAALRILLRMHPDDRSSAAPSSEAAAHFGGNLRIVHQVLLLREVQRQRRARMKVQNEQRMLQEEQVAA